MHGSLRSKETPTSSEANNYDTQQQQQQQQQPASTNNNKEGAICGTEAFEDEEESTV